MNRRSRHFGSVLLMAMALAVPVGSMAQVKPAHDTAKLLRSIGITKPAMSKPPDFSLRDIGGATVSLASYRGSLVLLNFWATWCRPCRDEMPSMEKLSRNFAGQGFALLAINQKESAAQVAHFMRAHGLNFPTPLDSDGRVSAAYRVFGIPETYIIDGSGNAIGKTSGGRDWARPDVVGIFRNLIGDNGSAAPGGSMALEPPTPMPRRLRARGYAVIVRSQQDPFSQAIAELADNEEVVPFGKASGAGEFWYMVRTRSGALGWVRVAELDELRPK